MPGHFIALCRTLPILAATLALTPPTTAMAPTTATASAPREVPAPPAAGVPRAPGDALRPGAADSGLRATDLALWNDPDFQRRFTESYLAESEVEPRVTAAERGVMQEVLELIASDALDEAVARLEKQRARAGSAVYDFTLANIHFQREEFERAAVEYLAAVESYPKFRRAWKNLGLIRVRQGDFQEAVRAFTRVVELGGGDALTYGLLGFSHAAVENHMAAESAYRLANLLDPQTMDWSMGLARSFFKQGRFADAVALCGQLIEQDKSRADLWLLQANAYIGLQQPLRAAENYEIVENLGRSTRESLEMLGDIYVNEELFDLGVSAYLRALERFPQAGPERALRAARVLSAHGETAATRQLAERIEELRGDALGPADRKELLKLRARIAVAEGAGEEEAALLKEIVEVDPLDGEALLLLAQHSGRAGDVEQAVFYYERAANLEEFEADAKVGQAQLLVGQRRYAEALPLLRRAQVLKPRENVQQYLEQVERVAGGR